jgi:predicted enzyme related to lactoylglutathione lyase
LRLTFASGENLCIGWRARKGSRPADPASSDEIRAYQSAQESEAILTGELAFFELGVEDAERGRAFYSALFGWRFEPGPHGGFTIEAPVPGGIHGGDQGASPYLFFAVDDIEAAAARVRELGGTVEELDAAGDEETVTRFGHFRICRDDQGSPFGLHQAPDRGTNEGS